MTSKQEIKQAFIAEIINTAEYQIILKVKQAILDEILAPKVKEIIVYNFETPLTTEQLNNIKLCMIVEFGFYTDNMSLYSMIIDMKKFLE